MSKLISITLSDKEYDAIEERAEREGMTASEYMKQGYLLSAETEQTSKVVIEQIKVLERGLHKLIRETIREELARYAVEVKSEQDE